MGLILHEKRHLFSLFGFGVKYPFKTDIHLKVKDRTKAFIATLTMISSSATRVQRPRLVAH